MRRITSPRSPTALPTLVLTAALGSGLAGGCGPTVTGDDDPAEVDAGAARPDARGRADAPVSIEESPDARPAPDAALADACTPTWVPLSVNGGFDAGLAPWQQSGNVVFAETAMPILAQAGTHAAWFAGVNDSTDRLTQDVVVPATATALRVRAHECFVTSDHVGLDDLFTVTLRDGAGASLEVIRSASNLQVEDVCNWTAATWSAVGAYPGQTVTLELRGTNDAAFPTSWFVDSVEVEALACP
ncbi:MAG: hypothetical protein KBG28_10390 [Kofleriaceae bacterium]|jgi:hypothetical protein|nr:hypothetical protein [Kofleriaceae bacterium]MBP6838147.1 hypothetical protein [Kofleriaceae bacterium]MBP9204363.1 hypothetical protein [Kofleriaceae bacterium]